MLFNSWVFAFAFLPVTIIGFYLLRAHASERLALTWLGIASLVFYGWWSIKYLFVLLASTVVNFYAAQLITDEPRRSLRLWITATVMLANLALLGFFKYAGFLVETVNAGLGTTIPLYAIVLPLGISFFTFQKIAYLADIYAGQPAERSPINFLLFVSFFPQLIAGPIVHHRDVLPQFARQRRGGPDPTDISVGLVLFAIGLFKKTMLADPIGVHATMVFAAATKGMALTPTEAWLGALSYAFQIYFDFSGYSDMAIGLARMFGVRLPLNFASPYRSLCIIDFWRRWHMTLSRFLRDYIYIPLGGNRRGPARRYVNLMTVMLVGGLWHGAGWTFIVWGGLHGLYLLTNHAWHELETRTGYPLFPRGRVGSALGWALTFGAVLVAWVFFRAPSLAVAGGMVGSMFGSTAVAAGEWPRQEVFGDVGTGLLQLSALWVIVMLAPNAQTLLRKFEPALDWQKSLLTCNWLERILVWQPSLPWMLVTGCGLALSVMRFSSVTEFIYFNF
jgi:D-alanyl-lipoteichoic acid acyltransferase DltB (MBOAT superfamily)